MMRYLGSNWGFLMTDVTAGAAGNDERIAFVFDLARLKPSGLACELVVPQDWLDEIGVDALKRQLARTPYAVSFLAGQTTFILVTAHIDYGDQSAERVPELKAIARWMRDWAGQANRWHHNLLTLGDFNIDRAGDALWQAFTSTGSTVPDDLVRALRTVFSDPAHPDLGKFYDPIAWFVSGDSTLLNMNYQKGGSFNFLPHVYTDTSLSKTILWRRRIKPFSVIGNDYFGLAIHDSNPKFDFGRFGVAHDIVQRLFDRQKQVMPAPTLEHDGGQRHRNVESAQHQRRATRRRPTTRRWSWTRSNIGRTTVQRMPINGICRWTFEERRWR